MTRLPNAEHSTHPWRIDELVADFRLEDVWQLPGGDDAGDLVRMVEMITSQDPSQSTSCASRTLFAIRWWIGELLGWDGPDTGIGTRVPTLHDRLPADLGPNAATPTFEAGPFSQLFLTEDEWAAEIANQTVHGVIHVGRYVDETGPRRMQMAIYVKPNGLLGTAYMAAIKPFRYLIVYPSLLRHLERRWQSRTVQT
jgi:hypothetical protein